MRIILFTFLLVILFSCGRKGTGEKESNPVLEIDLLSEPDSRILKLSDFASDVGYIPFLTTGSSLMGNVRRKIVNRGNRIYLDNIEGLSNPGIYCFDTDGKFLFKLQNSGRGPGEYTFVTDFDVSSDNKFLTLISSTDHKLVVYGISEAGFAYQRSISLKDPVPWRVSIVPETGNMFLAIAPWIGNEPALSLMINAEGDTVQFKPNCYKYVMARKTNYMAINEMLVYSIGNVVCFKEEFSDTVFCTDAKNNSFKPRMILNSHGTLSTPEMRGNPHASANDITGINNVFETPRYVLYWYSKGVIQNCILFDKSNMKKYRIDIDNHIKSRLKDDLSGGPDFNIEFLNHYCSGGRLFSFVEAITLKNYVASEDFKDAMVRDPKRKDELKRLADSLKETDNPVLVVVTPKE